MRADGMQLGFCSDWLSERDAEQGHIYDQYKGNRSRLGVVENCIGMCMCMACAWGVDSSHHRHTTGTATGKFPRMVSRATSC